jgi:hypothetical protein
VAFIFFGPYNGEIVFARSTASGLCFVEQRVVQQLSYFIESGFRRIGTDKNIHRIVTEIMAFHQMALIQMDNKGIFQMYQVLEIIDIMTLEL